MLKLKCTECNKMFHPQGMPNHKQSHFRKRNSSILQGEVVVVVPTQKEHVSVLADHIWTELSADDKVTALALFFTKTGA